MLNSYFFNCITSLPKSVLEVLIKGLRSSGRRNWSPFISLRHQEAQAWSCPAFLFCNLPATLGNWNWITSNGFAWTRSELIKMSILNHSALKIQSSAAVMQLNVTICFHPDKSNPISCYFSPELELSLHREVLQLRTEGHSGRAWVRSRPSPATWHKKQNWKEGSDKSKK